MRVPLPVAIVAGLLILLGLFATWAGYTDISPIVAGLSQAEPPADAAAAMIGARSLAMAVVLILGLVWKDTRVLLAGFIMAILREGQDLWITFSRSDMAMPVPLIAMFTLIIAAEAFCIYTLARSGKPAR